MYALIPYGTLAMTVGLALTRPRISARVRLGPALAGAFGVTILVAAKIIGLDDLESAGAALWRPLLTISSIWILTVIAESAGLLDGLARRLDARARTPRGLFSTVFWASAAATVVLNNDSAVMVLTPLAVGLARRRYPGRPELVAPFAFAVFLASGVAPLVISNPMNMIAAEYRGIHFNDYAARVIPIWLASTAVTWLVVLALFRRVLAQPSLAAPASSPSLPRPGARAILALLVAVLAGYPIVTAAGGPVWAVAAAGAALAIAVARRHRIGDARLVARAVSADILIFLWAVSVVGIGLRKVGLVGHLASLYAATDGSARAALVCGVSALGSAALNNHPMSIVNMMALEAVPHAGWRDTLAALIGGDLGPRFLPMGSLAGLIWLESLRRLRVAISLGAFLRTGALAALPALAAALAVLLLQ